MTSMAVALVDHMGSDLTVVNAARVSFGKHSDVLDEGRTKNSSPTSQSMGTGRPLPTLHSVPHQGSDLSSLGS